MLVALAVLAVAFFVLPTRVHERYIYPVAAIGAILAAVSWRWRLAYLVCAVATIANLYAVLTVLYPSSQLNVRDWLGIGRTLISYWGVATVAIAQTAVFLWAFSELRPAAMRRLAADIEAEADDGDDFERFEPDWEPSDPASEPLEPAFEPVGSAASAPSAVARGWTVAAPLDDASEPLTDVSAPPTSALPSGLALARPVWNERPPAGDLGPIEWLRSRLRDRPIR